MRERARSAEAKAERSAALLDAAEALAVELGGVRFVTIAAVTERTGLHRTGVRRYYASREALLLELAERGWDRWRDGVRARLAGRTNLAPRQVAAMLADAIAALPVFCDLLAHVAMSLEGDVDVKRARRFKTAAFAAHDAMVEALCAASAMTAAQIQALIAAAGAFAASFWQVAHPTPSLARLYKQVPRWGHVALDFAPRLRQLLEATAVGLAQ